MRRPSDDLVPWRTRLIDLYEISLGNDPIREAAAVLGEMGLFQL